jgi:hypothetical protein
VFDERKTIENKGDYKFSQLARFCGAGNFGTNIVPRRKKLGAAGTIKKAPNCFQSEALNRKFIFQSNA